MLAAKSPSSPEEEEVKEMDAVISWVSRRLRMTLLREAIAPAMLGAITVLEDVMLLFCCLGEQFSLLHFTLGRCSP